MVQRIDTRCDLMLFGALGDLAQRKLFPALYQLERAGLLAEGSRVLAIARAEGDTDSVRRQLYDRLQQHVKPVEFDPEMAHRFLARVAYLRLDFNDPGGLLCAGPVAPSHRQRTDRLHGDTALPVWGDCPEPEGGQLLQRADPSGGGKADRS